MNSRARIAALLTAAVIFAVLALGAVLASAVAPVVTVEAAGTVAYTTANVSGEVNPGEKETNCRFEYITDSQYTANEANSEPPFQGAEGAGCEQNPLSGNSLEPVSAHLANLSPASTYHLRLLAENEDGSEEAVAPTFTTQAVAKPTVSDIAISSVTASTAHFSAEVDPNGSDPAFDTSWHFTCTPECQGLTSGTVSGSGETVEADLTGLDPSTTYTVRLIAENAGGQTKVTEVFKTGGSGPLVIPFDAGPVQSTAADLNAEVDPRGSDTVYWFEWGTGDCSAPGASCQSVPPTRDASAGSGQLYKYVSRHITGLQPQTTYHFRVVAESALGRTPGPDRQFTTPAPEPACTNAGALGTSFLPDCRAWEMVSPPDKNGMEVIPTNEKNVVSADGDAITFPAVGPFGDVKGSGFDTDYVARRTGRPGTPGWATIGINPPGAAQSFTATVNGNNKPSYVGAFDPGLTAGIYQSWRPLTQAPEVSELTSLYRVSGLDDGARTPELLSDRAADLGPLPPSEVPSVGLPAPSPELIELLRSRLKPALIGASTDLSKAYFESPVDLTADTPQQNLFCLWLAVGCESHVYESDGAGLPRLVARIPAPGEEMCDDVTGPVCEPSPAASEAAITAGGSEPAAAGQESQRVVSADGSRVVFQTPPGGPIYIREDGERTYEVAESGTVWDASRNLARVFFSTTESLVPADQDGGQPDLYSYDLGEPRAERYTLISEGQGGRSGYFEAELATSDDGDYVYFVVDGDLTAAQPHSEIVGLYVWHDGVVHYIGRFTGIDEADLNSFRSGYGSISSKDRARITPDGQHLLFMTHHERGFRGRGGFTSGSPGCEESAFANANSCEEYILYDADSGRLVCATCNAVGPMEHGAFLNFHEGGPLSLNTGVLDSALSASGRYVFFTSAERLAPADRNSVADAYEYDARTGGLHLLSDGAPNGGASYLLNASRDGRDAFVLTKQPLSGWDVDGGYDIYDARVDGGFPEPAQQAAPCVGESCAPAAAALSTAKAGSSVQGPGNPKAPCRKPKKSARHKKGSQKARACGARSSAKSRRPSRHHVKRQHHGKHRHDQGAGR